MMDLKRGAATAQRMPGIGLVSYVRELLRVQPPTLIPDLREALSNPRKEELSADDASLIYKEVSEHLRRGRTPTELVLWGMLQENTGTHFLDSGGDSGRHWQRNAGRLFPLEDATTLKFGAWGVDEETLVPRNWEIEYTLNLWHFLAQNLLSQEDMDKEFGEWAQSPEHADENWLQCAQEWVAERFPDARGIYGDGAPCTENTYNVENLLSQDMQYTYWELKDDEVYPDGGYYLVSIHNGADARGGYTRPRVFTDEGEMTLIGDVARGYLSLDGDPVGVIPADQPLLPGVERPKVQEVQFHTDDGCHWYVETWPLRPAFSELNKYPATCNPELKGDGVHIYIDREAKRGYWIDGREIVG